MFGAVRVPAIGLVEYEPKGDSKLGPTEAPVGRVAFERGDVWIAGRGQTRRRSTRRAAASVEAFKHVDPDGRLADAHAIADVRLFRVGPGGAAKGKAEEPEPEKAEARRGRRSGRTPRGPNAPRGWCLGSRPG